MKASRRLALLLAALLALCVAFAAARVAEHARNARLELSARAALSVEPADLERLLALGDPVFATYYSSPRSAMPSGMRELEAEVTLLLANLQRAAPEHFGFQVLDPSQNPDLERFAAKRRVSPWRVRSVAQDSYSERTIWSSLQLSCGPRPPAVIQGLAPELLPRLKQRIFAELEAQASAPRARIALSAPGSTLEHSGAPWVELSEALAERGELERLDLNRGAPFPFESDLLFWADAGSPGPQRLQELERYLELGRSVVLLGDRRQVLLESAPGGGPALRLADGPHRPDALLAAFGLRALDALVCDQNSDQLQFEEQTVPAPFLVRCIAPNQDFHYWNGQANGTLLFTAPTPFAVDGARLRERGLEARYLANSSDKSFALEEPRERALALAQMLPESGAALPKQALLIELAPSDPWRGSLLAFAAGTPLQDGMYRREGTAHWRLLDAVLDEYLSNARLVGNRIAPRVQAEPLEELVAAKRAAWRALVMLGWPAVLLLVLLSSRASLPREAPWRWPQWLLPPLVGAALALLLARASPAALLLDCTQEGLNQLAPGSRATLERLPRDAALQARLFASPAEILPPELRGAPAALEQLLKRCAAAGAPLAIESCAPELLSASELSQARARGLSSFDVQSQNEELTSVRRVYLALEVRRTGGQSCWVEFRDSAALEELEFRVLLALERAVRDRPVRLGFASDVPRLSAAEAFDYQQQGLFAPMGTDVYSQARERLAQAGFTIVHVNPREPELPADLDALLWLQPRRDIRPMLEAFTTYLHTGGRALLAAQHFVVQSRQYPGTNYQIVYWPQPQSPDVEQLFFPDLGVKLMRELVFDELKTGMALESQVLRGAHKDFAGMDSALPFLIRASNRAFAALPWMQGLGDQAPIFASYWSLDAERLASFGLRAQPLLETSQRCWTFAWTNGWLPAEVLAGPARDAAGAAQWRPALPLGVQLVGTFPAPLRTEAPPPKQLANGAIASGMPGLVPDPARPGEAAGELLLLGASEMFKNTRLLEPEFRSDQLLLNLVAHLALDADLAEVAAHRPAPRALGLVEDATRERWRVLVLAAPLAGLLLLAGAWWALRRNGRSALAGAAA